MTNILVVEDDKYLANAYRIKLIKSGFTVSLANDGESALKILEAEIPDIILLDLFMPFKDGYSTLQDIKAKESLKHIPVIITSNSGTEEDVKRCLALGANDYVVKSDMPIENIVAKINSILNA